jgi:hypothetical protein
VAGSRDCRQCRCNGMGAAAARGRHAGLRIPWTGMHPGAAQALGAPQNKQLELTSAAVWECPID